MPRKLGKNMSKVLVTGSSGLVGSECVSYFEEKGWEVIGIDSNMRSYFFGTPKKVSQFDIDIRDEKSIGYLFSTIKFDAVIHAAAQPSHDWARKEPLTDFDINARGTLILLEATRKFCPKATFVYVSTDKVYGENMVGKRLSDENLGIDFAGKRSLFGVSKTAADLYVQEYGNYFNMNTVCFRPGCITGRNHEGAEEHGFLAYVAKCVREGKEYRLLNNSVRDQIHVHDLVSAFYAFIGSPKKAAVYNIGGGPERAISVVQAIDSCEKCLHKKIEIKSGPKRTGDRDYDVHDVSKFRKDYPEWDYEYSLSDIIQDVCVKKDI